jgi:hypothetical protein
MTVHHLRLQLHLQLFAALPESLDGLLKTHCGLRIPVHISATIHTKNTTHVPDTALNEFADQVLHRWVLLKALQKGLSFERAVDVRASVLI